MARDLLAQLRQGKVQELKDDKETLAATEQKRKISNRLNTLAAIANTYQGREVDILHGHCKYYYGYNAVDAGA
jgi:hypothetical protein